MKGWKWVFPWISARLQFFHSYKQCFQTRKTRLRYLVSLDPDSYYTNAMGLRLQWWVGRLYFSSHPKWSELCTLFRQMLMMQK
jgi:hypothetical protein